MVISQHFVKRGNNTLLLLQQTMDMKDEDILKLRPDVFPERFYKNVIGEKLASHFYDLGIDLDIDSHILDAWRKDLQSGVVGNAKELANRVLFRYRENPEKKLQDLYVAVKRIQGRVGEDLLVAARKEIDERRLVVTDGTDGQVLVLPTVPRENGAQGDNKPRKPDLFNKGNQSGQVNQSTSGATSAPPTAVVAPLETRQQPISADTLPVTMEANSPRLYRLPSDQNPDESLEGLL